jgi:hypothetical protein
MNPLRFLFRQSQTTDSPGRSAHPSHQNSNTYVFLSQLPSDQTHELVLVCTNNKRWKVRIAKSENPGRVRYSPRFDIWEIGRNGLPGHRVRVHGANNVLDYIGGVAHVEMNGAVLSH